MAVSKVLPSLHNSQASHVIHQDVSGGKIRISSEKSKPHRIQYMAVKLVLKSECK